MYRRPSLILLVILSMAQVCAGLHTLLHADALPAVSFAGESVSSHDCGDNEIHHEIGSLHHCGVCVRNNGGGEMPGSTSGASLPLLARMIVHQGLLLLPVTAPSSIQDRAPPVS